jgi:NAD(P)-dependent dehydrogenase (short-subunit alcohol dehydrogenase family)
MDLTGKVAFITGAAGGVGAATAQRLAGLGATVVGADVVDERGRDILDGLGDGHRYCHLDVSDAAEWQGVVDNVVNDLGGLDIVHLNAGVMIRPAGVAGLDDPVQWLTAEGYRRVMGVNADGVAFGLMATLPHLEAQGGGDIIVTSSVAGISPLVLDPVYSMSKHALIGMVLSLAPLIEPRGVRLNAICPGGVDTGIVPPDLKGAIALSPPSFIADVVVDILESSTGGEVWVAMSDEPRAVWQHQFAPLQDSHEPAR